MLAICDWFWEEMLAEKELTDRTGISATLDDI